MNFPEPAPPIRHICFLDTETFLFSPGNAFPKLVSFQYAIDDAPVKVLSFIHDFDELTELLIQVLNDDETLLVGHHIAYDMGVLFQQFAGLEVPGLENIEELIFNKYAKNLVSCTKAREKLIRIATGEMSSDPSAGAKKQSKFDLGEIVWRRFNVHMAEKHEDVTTGEKPWRLRYSELYEVPVKDWPEKAYNYAKDDIEWLRKVWTAQAQDPTAPTADMVPGLMEGWMVMDELAQARKAWAFQLLEGWGNRTDPEAVSELIIKCSAEVDAANEILKDPAVGFLKGYAPKKGKNAGVVSWSKNMAKIKAAVENILGDDVPKTPGGGTSTSTETLQLCLRVAAGSNSDALRGIQALVDMNESQDTMAKWAAVLDQGTRTTIHPHYNALVETGRTSCYAPNLQNPKRKGGVRECFVPRKGYVFVFADYSTLELRSLAQVCLDLFGYSRMAELLKQGRDLHLAFAADMNGKTYDEALAALKAKEPWAVDGRQLAKAFNFGVPGGLGAETFIEYAWDTYKVRLVTAEQYKEMLRLAAIPAGENPDSVPDPTPAELHQASIKRFKYLKWQVYYGTFPEVREYHNWMGKECAGNAGARALVHLPTGRIRGQVPYTAACNSLFQGRAADGAKEALWMVCRECYSMPSSPLYGSRPVLFLHDEIALEVPDKDPAFRHAAAKRLEEVMVEAMSKYIPDIPIEAGPVMMRRWYKGADPVYVDGLLVPGKPEVRDVNGKKKTFWVQA